MALAACVVSAEARVTRIVIDETAPAPAAARRSPTSRSPGAPSASSIPHPRNRIIQDIALAKDRDGKVRYVATFVIVKPVDGKQASGLLWHDVPNRGRVYAMARPSARPATSSWAAPGKATTRARRPCRRRPPRRACSGCSCRWRAAGTGSASPATCWRASSTAPVRRRSRCSCRPTRCRTGR
jgi:hypothetical protein